MKIRLQVAVPGAAPYPFQHPGPSLRVGRNTDNDLPLQGPGCDKVSGNHARIDLAPGGATLTDVGSTNHTLLNDRQLDPRVPYPIREGDRINLAYAGPVLQVVELALAAPEPAPARALPPKVLPGDPPAPGPAAPGTETKALLVEMHRSQQRTLLGVGVGAGALVVLILAATGIVILKNNKPSDTPPTGPAVAVAPPTNPIPEPKKDNHGLDKTNPSKPVDVVPNPVPVVVPVPELPPSVTREVGRYVVRDKEPASVLLQKRPGEERWAPVHPNNAIKTGYYYLSLPGYRSKIHLANVPKDAAPNKQVESTVLLTLWGNVPEFSSDPPVLESMVLLQDPEPGFDLDLVLERGRIHLRNFKAQGSARVRIRFQRETWDLTLLDGNSEAAVELFGFADPAFAREGGKPPLTFAGLFTQGATRLKTGQQEHAMSGPSLYVWASEGKSPPPESVKEKPPWWADRLDQQKDEVAMMVNALEELHELLAKRDDVLDAVLTRVRAVEPGLSPQRAACVYFLNAMDAVPHVLTCLNDPSNSMVRQASCTALRSRLGWVADFDRELFQALQARHGLSEKKAELVMQLLHDAPDPRTATRARYEELLGHLRHENVEVRELAYLALTVLAREFLAKLPPEQVKTLAFDAAGPVEERDKAILQWRGLLDKLPGAPAGGR